MPSVAENVAPQRAERNPKGLSPGAYPYELLITQEDFASPHLSHVLARMRERRLRARATVLDICRSDWS